MALTSADGFFSAARQNVVWRKTAATTTIAIAYFSLLPNAGTPSAGSLSIGNTTTGIVPTSATAGFPALTAFGSGNTGYLAAATYTTTVAGALILYDRLWHAT